MIEKKRFGLPLIESRTDNGTLRTIELEKIIYFLNRRGVIITNCFDRKIIIVHPQLVKNIQEDMEKLEFKLLVIGSNVTGLRKNENFNIIQNRVLEALTPGALIIRCNGNRSVAIPDNIDLRDISNLYDGTLEVFITNEACDEIDIIERLLKIDFKCLNLTKIGVLECPYYGEDSINTTATVVDIPSVNIVKVEKEGVYDLQTVKQASSTVSQYEMGEWI